LARGKRPAGRSTAAAGRAGL